MRIHLINFLRNFLEKNQFLINKFKLNLNLIQKKNNIINYNGKNQ